MHNRTFIMRTLIKKIACLGFLCALSQTVFAFSPYADLTINVNWNTMQPMDLIQVSQASGIKDYHLAFINDAGSCTPAWGSQTAFSVSNAWASTLTDKMRANNIHYTVAFGGATGNDLSMSCSTSQLVNAYEQVIQTYQPQGLDFDIENGSANVPKLMQALQQVQHAHPTLKLSFTLPVLPEGLIATGEDVVKQAKAANLSYAVNIMAMDYGPSYKIDSEHTMATYAIQASTKVFNFLKTLYPEKSDSALWNMIEVTPMIGVNDVNSEIFTLSDATTLNNFAKQNHLGGLAMWSVARDNPCPGQYASPICSGANVQTAPYDFAKAFIQ